NYGYARIKTVVDSVKNIPGEHALFIHCGDMFPGTLYYNMFKGRADITSFNMMDLDILVLGNHEFDGGADSLAAVLEMCDAEVISANIENLPRRLKEHVKPYVIKKYDGIKVGIIGLVTKHTREIAITGQIEFTDYVPAIRKYVQELRGQNCDYIILAAHIGYPDAPDLIRRISGVDIIIDGHSHILCDSLIADKTGKLIPYRQARHHAQYIGIYTAVFDNNGDPVEGKSEGKMLELTSAIPQDRQLADSIRAWSVPLQEFKNTTVGYLSQDFPYQYPEIRMQSIPLANLVADAMLWAAKPYGAQAAIANAGGIREPFEAPEVTYEDVFRVLPFNNTLDIITLTGDELIETIRNALETMREKGAGRFPQIANLRVEYTYPAFELVKIEIKSGDKYVSVQNGEKYSVAVNSYMACGGDGYYTLANAEPENRMEGIKNMQAVMSDYFFNHSSPENPLDIKDYQEKRINGIKR
ncbi:MAG: hypothetical protein GF307_05600, partial [candidate division Zixibacteria bacterium]|nr:hypothetical protein [candidate division Zixibacteria bacterium]